MLKAAKRVLLVKKTSRLEFEKKRARLENNKVLARKLAQQGSDYCGLLQRHRNHENNSKIIQECLESKGMSVAVRDREGIRSCDVNEADLVVAAGGDGNFLMAASKVHQPDLVVVGINTDPEKSEGHLCITPSASYSIKQIVDDIFSNRLRRIGRQRIRVSSTGPSSFSVLALNEVFVGDEDPSQACYFELSCDNEPSAKIRSSGLLVYTGTGSTSWAYNTRKMYASQVARILSIAEGLKHINAAADSKSRVISDDAAITAVTRLYNEELVFPGDDTRMGCVIREPIKKGSTHGFLSNPARYCNKLIVKSRSFANRIIVDGYSKVEFPEGSIAEFSINPEDTLLTLSDSKSTTENR